MSLICPKALCPHLNVLQFTLDRRTQARQIILAENVMSASLYCVHGYFFSGLAGYDDDWRGGPMFCEDR